MSGVGLAPVIESFLPKPPPELTTNVRIIIGMNNNTAASLGGNVPGVALWDKYGNSIGSTFGSSKKLAQGSFVDIQVVANKEIGNVPAEYLAITNGGDDAICIAGVTLFYPDGTKAAWSADVAAQCTNTGAFIFQNDKPITQAPAGQPKPPPPHCVWIDRNKSGGIPHQGIGIHLPDFGDSITEAQAEAYNHTNDLMCSSGPRFRMYEQLRTENPILVFEPFLNYTDDGTDVDPSHVINNPGVFANQDKAALTKACGTHSRTGECTAVVAVPPHVGVRGQQEPRKRAHPMHYLLSRGDDQSISGEFIVIPSTSISNPPTNSASPHSVAYTTASTPMPTAPIDGSNTDSSQPAKEPHRFDGHCIISSKPYHSAKRLCGHPYSFGPSLASTVESLFCDIIEKKLYKICDTQVKLGDIKTDSKIDTLYCFDISAIVLRPDSTASAQSSQSSDNATSSSSYSVTDGPATAQTSATVSVRLSSSTHKARGSQPARDSEGGMTTASNTALDQTKSAPTGSGSSSAMTTPSTIATDQAMSSSATSISHRANTTQSTAPTDEVT